MIEHADLEAESRGDHVLVRVTGELDVFNAAEIIALVEAAVPADAHGAVLDLSGVEFLDSTAIRRLFLVTARLLERRHEVHVVAGRGSAVERTLGLVDFERAAPMHASADDALRALEPGAPEAA